MGVLKVKLISRTFKTLILCKNGFGAVQKVSKRALRLHFGYRSMTSSATVLSPFSKGKIVLPALLGQPHRSPKKRELSGCPLPADSQKVPF